MEDIYKSASFRGVEFYVEQDSEAWQKSLVVHRSPHADGANVEELILQEGQFSFTAHLLGDDVQSQYETLQKALAIVGPGELIPPLGAPKNCHARSWTRGRHRDKRRQLVLEISFIEAGSQQVASVTRATEPHALEQIDLAQASSAIGFVNSISLDDVPDWVSAAGLERIETEAALLLGAPFGGKGGEGLRLNFEDAFESLSSLLSIKSEDATSLAQSTFKAYASYCEGAGDVGRDWMAEQAVTPSVAPEVTESQSLAAQNTRASERLIQDAQAIALAHQSVQSDFASRSALHNYRKKMRSVMEEARSRAALNNDVPSFNAFASLSAAVLDDLKQKGASLAVEREIAGQAGQPAIVLAYDLYEDDVEARALEITRRNEIAHPSFLSNSLTVLAS